MSRTINSTVRYATAFMSRTTVVLHSTRQRLKKMSQMRELRVRPIDWLYTNRKAPFQKLGVNGDQFPVEVCTKCNKPFLHYVRVVHGTPYLTYISVRTLPKHCFHSGQEYSPASGIHTGAQTGIIFPA